MLKKPLTTSHKKLSNSFRIAILLYFTFLDIDTRNFIFCRILYNNTTSPVGLLFRLTYVKQRKVKKQYHSMQHKTYTSKI